MTMDEIVTEVSYRLGLTSNKNVENHSVQQAITIAFRELKRYMRTPVDKTVPYSKRIDLKAVGIYTQNVLNVFASLPRIGLTLGTIDSGNVFQVASAANTYSQIGNTTTINIDPVMTQMAMAQVRNTLGTDFQWTYDSLNQIVMCAHRDPMPTKVTIRYVPDFQDVSEIVNPTWIDYLIRLSEATWKKSVGRSRSKYTIEGSNVSLDGKELLAEANAELEQLREELESRRQKLVVLN